MFSTSARYPWRSTPSADRRVERDTAAGWLVRFGTVTPRTFRRPRFGAQRPASSEPLGSRVRQRSLPCRDPGHERSATGQIQARPLEEEWRRHQGQVTREWKPIRVRVREPCDDKHCTGDLASLTKTTKLWGARLPTSSHQQPNCREIGRGGYRQGARVSCAPTTRASGPAAGTMPTAGLSHCAPHTLRAGKLYRRFPDYLGILGLADRVRHGEGGDGPRFGYIPNYLGGLSIGRARGSLNPARTRPPNHG